MKKLNIFIISLILTLIFTVSCNVFNKSTDDDSLEGESSPGDNNTDIEDGGNTDNSGNTPGSGNNNGDPPSGGNNGDTTSGGGTDTPPFTGNDNLSKLCVLSSDTAKISTITADGATTVTLTDTGTNSALTVRVPVDATWNYVKITQGKTVTYAKSYAKGDVTLVDFSILPNAEDAIIIPEVTSENKTLESEFGMTLQNGTKVDTNYYPGFVRKSVTFTIDDGNIQYDTQFINIVKPAGLMGTFNLNRTTNATAAEYLALYDGYEIANHHSLHALPFRDPVNYHTGKTFESILKDEIFNSKTADTEYAYKTSIEGFYYINYHYYSESYIGRTSWHAMASDDTYISYAASTKDTLESLFGDGSVVGFAYPHGVLTETIKQYLKDAGYLYARDTGNLKDKTNFALPADRFEWTYNADVSCMLDVMAKYDALADDGQLKFFSFGVHSKDFVDKWNVLEEFAALYGNRPENFWYATNRQIFEYEDAIKALVISEEKIANPSDVTVFITVNGEKVIIPANSVYYYDGSIKAIVSFDADNGTDAVVSEYETGSLISQPAEPTKNGFSFIGWYDGDKKWNFNNRVTEGIILKAKYEANEFTDASAEVLPVKGGAGGIVTLIHDDGRSGSGIILDELYLKYGLIGDVAMLVGNIYNSSTETTKAEYDKWKAIIDTGRWGIISHSMTHTWWGNVTKDASGNNAEWEQDDEKMFTEIVTSQEILRELFPEHRVLTFAYPGFSSEKSGLTKAQYLEIIYSEEARALIDEYYISARKSFEATPVYVTEEAYWTYVDAFFLSPAKINGTGSDSLYNRLESAANDGRIQFISLHAVGHDVTAGEWDGYTLSSDDMETACKMVSEYVNAGKIWNAHYEDAVLYVREAQDATITASGDANGITVSLTHTLGEVFNYPLTVRVTIPGAWEAVKITQGESVSYAVAKYTDGKWCIDADILPNAEEASLEAVAAKDIPAIKPDSPKPTPDFSEPTVPSTPTNGLKVDTTVNFDGGTGASSINSSSVEYVTRDTGKALRVIDSLTDAMGGCNIPLSETKTAEAFSLTFDINIAEATSFAATIYFANASKTPYMLYVQASGGGYFLGDCSSNSGGAGTKTQSLTGSTVLEFDTWYTIKIVAVFTSADSFKAVWYVNGEKTGESTNRANYTKVDGAALQNSIDRFEVSSLSGALLDMQLDNIVMKAGDAVLLGLDGTTALVNLDFDTDISGIDNKKPECVNVSSATLEDGEGSALCVEKYATGTSPLVIAGNQSFTEASELYLDFDINIQSSNACCVAQIFFHTSIASSPYDFTIIAEDGGYLFGSLTSASGGTHTKYNMDLLEYGKTYHITLKLVLGSSDTFLATLYVDGNEVGTSDAFYNPNKTEGYQPRTEVNAINIYYQSAALSLMYLDNIVLRVK